MPIKPIKIAVISAGKVGIACAHVFINLRLCQELVPVDTLTERTLGEVWDLDQGGFLPPMVFVSGRAAMPIAEMLISLF